MNNRLQINDQNVQDYLNRFFDGTTSNAEEQALYAYFRRNRLPADIAPYQQLFAYFENGLDTTQPTKQLHRPIHQRRWVVTAMGIAALFILTYSIIWGIKLHQHHRLYAQYEGSFRIENGKKITDIKQLLPYIKQAEQTADSLYKEGEILITQQAQQRKQLHTELSKHIDDPEFQKEIDWMLEP